MKIDATVRFDVFVGLLLAEYFLMGN